MTEPVNDNRKTQKNPLNDRVNFRVNALIKKDLEQRATASKQSLSGYLIACGQNKALPAGNMNAGDRQLLIKALGELGKVGSNVNQLAKAANQNQAMTSAAIDRAMQAVELCADQIRFLLTGYNSKNDDR